MPVHNSEIADIFDHVADLLEIKGANRFRVRVYRNAANTVRDQSRSVAEMVENDEDLCKLPDIGEDLAGKIAEIVKNGQLSRLQEISGDVPDAIVAATRIPGIGPKRAKALFEELGLGSIDDIRGDLHAQTKASDGKNTLREMARAAQDRGYGYLAFTDQSKSQSVAGRLIGSRRPYQIDVGRVVEAAEERGCCLELNADPHRLDLNNVNCRMARDHGVKIALSTDAHSTGWLGNMRYGVDQARRGWLGAADVLNTRSWRDVARILQRG